MPWFFTIVLLAWPAVEIAAFIQVAHWIGFLGAIAGIILSGMAGAALLRVEGLATAQRAQAQLGRGEMPVAELFDAACLAVAGLLLILPGYVTDLLAIALILPPVRLWMRTLLARRLRAAGMAGPGPARGGPSVIDGEWTVVPPDHEEGQPREHDGAPGRPRLPR